MLQTKASDSSQVLEARLEPIPNVALVIVHVNDHYESVDVCEKPIKQLLEARVASHIYEHASHYQSFLRTTAGVKPEWKQRYTSVEQDGINYCIINNETDPGNYDIAQLSERRLILVGGGLGDCHNRASSAATEYLFSRLRTSKVREIHLPLDSIYTAKQVTFDGELYIDVNLNGKPDDLLKYVNLVKQQGRSYLATVDRKVVAMDMSFEQRTLHLAVWHNSTDMISYLRNKDRLSLKGE